MKINVYTGNEGQNFSVAKIFDNIIKLYRGGYIADGLITSVTDDTIVTPSVEFVKFNRVNNTQDKTVMSMSANGANWFEGLRSKKTEENDFAVWQRFIEMVADEFHRKYSFLEYPTINLNDDVNAESDDYKKITNVLSTLSKHLKNYKIIKRSSSEMIENIYGSTMRLEVSDGTGEALPILGKLYFHTVGKNGMAPMEHHEAKVLNQLLEKYILISNEVTAPDYKAGGESVSALMKSIEELFNGQESFEKFLSIDDKSDQTALNELVARGANDDVDVVCRRAKILSFFHVNCTPRCYKILFDNDTLFNVTVGLGDSLTFYCAHCSEKIGKPVKLVDNDNLIIQKVNGERFYTPINCNEIDLGMSELSSELVSEIIENNPFKFHARKIECNHLRMEKPCKKFVCNEECFMVDVKNYPSAVSEDKRHSILCVNCPYSEIVYNINGKQYATAQLSYCCDTNALDEKINTKTCDVCNRNYSIKYFDEGQSSCKFCSSITQTPSEKVKMRSQKLYKLYSDCLPLSARLKAVGKPKLCAEDDEIILFKLGEELRVLAKQSIYNKGVLPSPLLVNKKGVKS